MLLMWAIYGLTPSPKNAKFLSGLFCIKGWTLWESAKLVTPQCIYADKTMKPWNTYFRMLFFYLHLNILQQWWAERQLNQLIEWINSVVHPYTSNVYQSYSVEQSYWSCLLVVVAWKEWENTSICQQEHYKTQDDILYLSASWCSKSSLFCNYDISTIALNWKVFL